MSELPILGRLSPVRRQDTREELAWLAPEGMNHPGRMRVAFAREALSVLSEMGDSWQRRQDGLAVVADPLAGVGTTLAALALVSTFERMGARVGAPRGYRFFGAERDLPTVGLLAATCLGATAAYPELRASFMAGDAADMEPGWIPEGIDLLFTSPMFPKTHNQGRSARQAKLRETSKTSAGNDDGHATDWQGEARWKASLRRTVGKWAREVVAGGLVAVHVRQHVEAGAVVAVDQWAVEVLADATLQALGVLAAPLAFRSKWKEMHRRPLVRVVGSVPLPAGGHRLALACNPEHWAEREDLPEAHVRCVQCPALERPEIMEERIVVFRKVTA